MRQRVQEHGGREVEALGDGFLVAFGSARTAVACAVEHSARAQGAQQQSASACRMAQPLRRCGGELGHGLMSTQTDIIVLKITARMRVAG